MPAQKTSILIVDDEPRILSALARMLRLEAFDIVSCERPSLALEQAEARSFDIVISDFRMPEMTGIALMEKLAELIPYSMRLLMSGNADLRDVIEAVNAGSIHQFIEKPWNDGAVKVTLRRIAAEIKTRREKSGCLPPSVTRFETRSMACRASWLHLSQHWRVSKNNCSSQPCHRQSTCRRW